MQLETAENVLRESARERKEQFVNVGEPSITGLVEKGRPERKNKCEDVKLKDTDRGLFAVADGVSSANGWYAAKETAQIVSDELGSELDAKIERIASNPNIQSDRKNELVDALIRNEIQAVILKADESIRMQSKLDSKIHVSATTLSLAKLVDAPSGDQHLYYANVGDSSIFLLRNGKLLRLSHADNMLMDAARNGSITVEQARKADQADSIYDVPDDAKFFYQHRRILTSAVGNLKDQTIRVERLRVLSGDRILICSDGITDQLKETQILQLLLASKDDRRGEREIQQAADSMSVLGVHTRSKADDESAIIQTIFEKRQRAVVKEQKPEQRREITRADVEAWRAQIPKVQALLKEKKQSGADSNEIAKLNDELARLIYWVSHMGIQEIQENTPPRFQNGDRVRVKRYDLDPPGFDPHQWIVFGFNQEQDSYILARSQGGKPVLVERFKLELWQSGNLVQNFDKVEMTSNNGKKVVYSVSGEEDGKMVLIRESLNGIERRIELSSVVEKALRDQFGRARAMKKYREHAMKQLLDKPN